MQFADDGQRLPLAAAATPLRRRQGEALPPAARYDAMRRPPGGAASRRVFREP